MKDLAEDTYHALYPVGPIGKPTELQLAVPILAFNFTKYPNAAKAFIAFMLEKENYEKWLSGARGYLTHTLNAYDSAPVWTADPKNQVFSQASKRALPASGIGTPGEKAATAIADFIVVDMFANYCTGIEGCQDRDVGSRTATEAHLSLTKPDRAAGNRRPILPFSIGTSHMADIALEPRVAKPQIREATTWDQIRTNRNWLGFWFMVPAMGFLIFFLAYPLGLGIWISFTDAKIGRPGQFIGIENYEWLWDDSIFWLSVFNTLLYTFIASAIKFAIGLYLALLLNENMPFKAMLRALVLIPSSCRPCCRRWPSGGSSIPSSRSSPGR